MSPSLVHAGSGDRLHHLLSLQTTNGIHLKRKHVEDSSGLSDINMNYQISSVFSFVTVCVGVYWDEHQDTTAGGTELLRPKTATTHEQKHELWQCWNLGRFKPT